MGYKNTFVLKKHYEIKIVTTATILGMIAIILGAFGAHALKKFLAVEQLATLGVRYQMYHALFYCLSVYMMN
jgi:uncharacterized membrane protein YgdD (TMEM256/DUF423 family)